MIKTRNFNPDVDTKLKCTCGHPDCDQRSVKQWVLNQAQHIRDDYNKSMAVTSGGRCPNHPDELHKTKAGDHQECTALDIYYETVIERNKLMVLAGRHGATRVAWGSNFVHMAWTKTNDRSVPTWEY